jgi:hemerythrin superfamily protein
MATTTSDENKQATQGSRGARARGRGGSKSRSSSEQNNGSSRRAFDAMKENPLALGAAAAAVGVLTGLAASLGRKAAVQAPAMMAGDWLEALKAEHKAVLTLFDKLQETGDEKTTRRAMLLGQLKHALAKHAVEEENAVYPALRDAGQTAEADRLNQDHGYVKQYLYDLGNMPKNEPGWMAKVIEFRSEIERHMREEENEIFPRLKTKLDMAENKVLATAVAREGFKLA